MLLTSLRQLISKTTMLLPWRYYLTSCSYVAKVGAIIAKAQITNGGPVILYQPENEYSAAEGTPFPNHDYLKYVNDQVRKAGIVVPLINNDAWQGGTGAPGTGKGAVDIYVRQPTGCGNRC